MNMVSTLLDALVEVDPARPALLAPRGPVVSYGSLQEQVAGLALFLQRAGIARHDRIGIVLPNGIDAVIAFLAAAAAGTAAPLNPAYKLEEFQYYLADTGARALIVPACGAELARQAVSPGMFLVESTIDAGGAIKFSTTVPLKADAELDVPRAEDVALVLHTSGTTSRPKRVPLTHANLLTSARNVAHSYALTSEDVAMCVMPLFHVHGLVASVLASLLVGSTVVVTQGFNALSFWPAVQAHRATWYSAVPAIHQMLLARSREGVRPLGSEGLRFIRSCSSALSPALMADLEARFGVPVLEAYGMTEASHQIATNPLPPAERKAGTVGLGANVEVGIMDKEGHLLLPGAQGEVVIRGANVIAGYEDNPQANATSFTNGWFRTGDEGIIDRQGYVKLVGRIKELIVRGGEKISPLEIDQVLQLHPAVAEVATFGVPHRVYGEEVEAAVELTAPATEEELLAFCRERLADFKCPKKIHIVERIPRTATGKIQRKTVAQKLGS
jgi:acyl-CoA synthetase (AMP-forming)/AMP-acid ligase II